MIYEFLYETKPVGLHLIAIAIFWALIFFSFSVYYYRLSRPPKEKYLTSTTYGYDANQQKEVVVSQTVSENIIDPPRQKILYEPYGHKCTVLYYLLSYIRI